MRKIYLDYAATTPVDKEVNKEMQPYFSDKFGNPLSIHSFGQEAQEGVIRARQRVAAFLGCQPSEIIFTSGATESNNLAIRGIIKKIRTGNNIGFKPHIITSPIEHHCVLDTCHDLERRDRASVTYLPISREGIVRIQDIEKAISEDTRLISIMYANNEIGTIQPIRQIGQLVKKINAKRSFQKRIVFHTDAVQASYYLDCRVDRLGVDLLSLSAHKIYGPKGIGALYVRKGTPLAKIQEGGSQEYNLRAGTHNVPGIIGLGAAISQIQNNKSQVEKIGRLRDKLIEGVLKLVPESQLNGSRKHRLPNNANFSFPGAEGESLLVSLDQNGVAVSTGSACAARSLEPSHVLLAIGLKPEEAHCSLRMTLGKYTTDKDIDYVLKILPQIVERLKRISGQAFSEIKADKKDKNKDEDFGC